MVFCCKQNHRTSPNENPENPSLRQRIHQNTGSIFNDTFVCKMAVYNRGEILKILVQNCKQADKHGRHWQ